MEEHLNNQNHLALRASKDLNPALRGYFRFGFEKSIFHDSKVIISIII